VIGACAGVIVGIVVVTGAVGASSSGPHRSPLASSVTVVANSRRLGPLSPASQLRLELTLAQRNRAALARLIASGRTVTPAEFARRFLPRTGRVRAVIRLLQLAGLHTSWTPGSAVLEAAGSAAAAERAFHVRLDRYRGASGQLFYAPSSAPELQPRLRGVLTRVAGLDDLGRVRSYGSGSSGPGSGCGRPLTGFGSYTPTEVLSAYHFDPLLQSGLTGAGQTVVFLEINTFASADLKCFASQFSQPPMSLTAAPLRWGSPDTNTHDEADMDLEIVHSVAPAAHLVVYYADSRLSDIAAAAATAMRTYPKAIFSVSLGGCEWETTDSSGRPTVSPPEAVWHDALEQLAATGGTTFISSGDQGAYTCGSQVTTQGGDEAPTVSSPADDPYATAVGGTTLFVGAGGTYAGEAAWGNPFSSAGSGGGLSLIWSRPAWQTGPGVQNQSSDSTRQLPDVAALGDANTGWNIFHDGSWDVVAGTSAAAPLWAGLIALTDETLASHSLAPVGFANPILYSFAAHPRREPAPAFNDVARGENLYYPATPGWDYATGLGTPNAAGIADDFLKYRTVHK
jgi:kumamolisin